MPLAPDVDGADFSTCANMPCTIMYTPSYGQLFFFLVFGKYMEVEKIHGRTPSHHPSHSTILVLNIIENP